MARIFAVDDYELYAEMFAEMLRREGGHEVAIGLTPLVPADLEAFGPDLVLLTIVRKLDALGHGALHDFYSEVDGARAFLDLRRVPAAEGLPIVVTSIGVREAEVPAELRHEAFVHVPQELDHLLGIIGRLLARRAPG